MSLFEYLGVLLSVVMGLAITHVLVGISKSIHMRATIKPYWVHLLWAVNVLTYVIGVWWGMFWWSGQDSWTFFQFMFVVLYAIFLFLLASLLYPWDFPADFDFEKQFFSNRRWFFGILGVAWCIDIPETLLKGAVSLREVPQHYFVFVGVLLVLTSIGIATASRRYHGFFAVFWLIWFVGYLSLTTLAKIAE